MNYKPTKPEQFLGPARKVAEALAKIALHRRQTGEPLKILLNGPPGTGKSSLAEFTVAQLGGTKFSTQKYNGTDVNIDKVTELRSKLSLRDMFGDFRVIHVDEADKIPHIAQVAFLTLLDDLPSQAAVICTSNCHLEEFEKRFQSRFETYTVKGPAADEIATFLRTMGVNPKAAARIAELSCGDVRAALNDASSELVLAAA